MIDPRIKWPPPLALPGLTPSTASLIDRVHCADALEFLRRLPSNFVNCIVTSPAYFGLRDYGIAGQYGLEDTPAAYVERLRVLFAEARRVLRDDGTLWLNIGDSYSGSSQTGGTNSLETNKREARMFNVPKIDTGLPPKSLLGIPWRLAFALQDDGWILRSDVIWHKPNPMPESVRDRPTKSHEYVFLFAKSPRYWYDADAIREENSSPDQFEHNQKYAKPYAVYDNRAGDTGQPGNVNNVGIHSRPGREGRNARSVWTIATQPNSLAHFAMMPPELARRCILTGCPRGGLVLDPFMGAGTTAKVAISEQRHYIGCELNPEYVDIANGQLAQPISVSLFDMARAL